LIFIGSFEILDVIYKNEGLRGLYVGSGGMLLREIPFNSLQMAFYSSLKDLPLSKIEIITSSTFLSSHLFTSAFLGVVASFLAAILTQPADVIKTRLMAEKNRNSNVFKELNEVIKTDGVGGLYVGLAPRILLCTVGGLLYFLISDTVNNSFSIHPP
jgi:hypothetical protein